MSAGRDKRIKKLSKIRIWPSVLLFAISLIMSAAVFGLFSAITIGDLALERISSGANDAVRICHAFDSAEDTQAVLDAVRNGRSAPDAMFVLDKDGNVIAGYGEKTYADEKQSSLGSISKFYSEEDYYLHLDNDYVDNLINNKGDIAIPVLESLERVAAVDGDIYAVIFEACFWVDYQLQNGDTAMVKCIAPIYVRDFLKSIVFGISAFGVTFLPTFIFFINIITNVRNQRRMRKILYTDPLTDGNSYICFEQNAAKALDSRKRNQYMIADVTVMKYRGFCNYHGIRAGEELLESIDSQINTYLKKGEVCAHSGKASFALLMTCPDRTSGETRMRTIVNELTDKFSHGGIVFHSGIYFTANNEAQPDGKQLPSKKFFDPADCFNRASAARSLLTDENVPAVAVYDDKLLEEQIWEHHVEERMQAALENEEFQVYVQPKYNPVTEELAGAEALVRWVNEEDGFVPPGKFIPIFEKNGFITKLDDYMLAHVAELQAKWLAEGKNIVPVSVNVSRAHFANPMLSEHICNIVDQFNVPHKYIEIELTESAFFDDKAALLRTVRELNGMGFEISMDDFGAGYSSLNSLKDLPLDVLKLDAEFFRGESEENRGEIVVSQAIALAKKLNMRIVAEGVEKKEQVDFLAGQGCDMIQGYYFAKPMPAAEYALGLKGGNDINDANSAAEAEKEAPSEEV